MKNLKRRGPTRSRHSPPRSAHCSTTVTPL
jgi:hypothetical protein